MKRGLVIVLASWGFLGYSPIVSGTVGTVGAIPLFLLATLLPTAVYAVLLIAFILFASWISGLAESEFGQKDSGKIVIDEVAGYLVTMFLIPVTWQYVLYGFLAFRFFDIVKIPPARQFDRNVKGGFGVVMDDVFAGIYANLALRLLMVLGL